MAEELVGPGSLKVANYPFCKMIYPTGETDWQLPDRGQMDGYTRPGQVDTFTLGIPLNLNDIQHRGEDLLSGRIPTPLQPNMSRAILC